MPTPPPKRGRLPSIEREEMRESLRPSSHGADDGSEREFLLDVLHKQTEYIVGKISDLRSETDARFIALEKDKLEDDRTRFEVQKMTATVRDLLESDRTQNTSIVALTAAMKPSVVATAYAEGSSAGKAAGGRAGKYWGILGSILAVIAAGAFQQCEQQISRGAFDAAPASSK